MRIAEPPPAWDASLPDDVDHEALEEVRRWVAELAAGIWPGKFLCLAGGLAEQRLGLARAIADLLPPDLVLSAPGPQEFNARMRKASRDDAPLPRLVILEGATSRTWAAWNASLVQWAEPIANVGGHARREVPSPAVVLACDLTPIEIEKIPAKVRALSVVLRMRPPETESERSSAR